MTPVLTDLHFFICFYTNPGIQYLKRCNPTLYTQDHLLTGTFIQIPPLMGVGTWQATAKCVQRLVTATTWRRRHLEFRFSSGFSHNKLDPPSLILLLLSCSATTWDLPSWIWFPLSCCSVTTFDPPSFILFLLSCYSATTWDPQSLILLLLYLVNALQYHLGSAIFDFVFP